MFILDAHLDLAMNAVEWNRDLTKSVHQIRESEFGMSDKPDRQNNTVSLDAMRKGNIGICVATQIARVSDNKELPGWNSQEEAWAHTQDQLAWYKSMEEIGEMVQIKNIEQLNKHLDLWSNEKISKKPIGYILSLEGADSIVNMDYLEKSYESGLRAIGPAHYGPGVYAHGTDSVGGIGPKGKELLKKMGHKKLTVDLQNEINEIPVSLNKYNLEIGKDKKSINYTYNVTAKSTGITNLLQDLKDANLKLQDLKTEQTTLEKIFVSLVKENNEV